MFNLLMIYRSPSQLMSALIFPSYDKARKYVGIPNCLTKARASHKNNFQFASVPLTELLKLKCIFTCNKSFNRFLQTIFNSLCCECICFNFLHSKFHWWMQVMLLKHWSDRKCRTWICCKVQIEFQQPLIKVPLRTYWSFFQ